MNDEKSYETIKTTIKQNNFILIILLTFAKRQKICSKRIAQLRELFWVQAKKKIEIVYKFEDVRNVMFRARHLTAGFVDEHHVLIARQWRQHASKATCTHTTRSNVIAQKQKRILWFSFYWFTWDHYRATNERMSLQLRSKINKPFVSNLFKIDTYLNI